MIDEYWSNVGQMVDSLDDVNLHSKQKDPLYSFCKSDVAKSRNTVVDLELQYSIHSDGYTAELKNQQAEVATLKSHNCNSADVKQYFISPFVLNTLDPDFYDILDCILKVYSAVGKHGIFIKRNNTIFHTRFFFTNLNGDYVALQEMENEKNRMNTTYYCNQGCRRYRFNPFLFGFVPMCNHMMGKVDLLDDVIHPFLYRHYYSSYSEANALVMLGCNNEVLRDLIKRAAPTRYDRFINTCSHLSQFFGLFSHIPILWKPTIIRFPVVIPCYYNSVFAAVRRCMPRHYESYFSQRPRNKDENDIYYAVVQENGYPEIFHDLLGKEDNPYTGGDLHLELDRIMYPSKKTRSISDFMHSVPNFVGYLIKFLHKNTVSQNFLICMKYYFGLDNEDLESVQAKFELSSDVRKGAASYLDTLIKSKGSPFKSLTNFIKNNNFDKQKSHEKLLFAFCYFDYCFQDDLNNPLIFCFSQLISIVSYYYNCRHFTQTIFDLQHVVDFLLHLITSITPPSYARPCFDFLEHLTKEFFCGGPFKEHDNFTLERRIKKFKDNNIISSNIEKSLNDRMNNLVVVTEALYQHCDEYNEVSDHDKAESYIDLCSLPNGLYEVVINLQLKLISIASYHDDLLFYNDDSQNYKTLLDIELETPETDTLLEEYYLDKNLQELSHLYNGEDTKLIDSQTVHLLSTVKIGSKYYTGACLNGLNITSFSYLEDNAHAIAFNQDYYGVTRVYLILGFFVVKMNNKDYVLSLVIEIPSDSVNSYVETPFRRRLQSGISYRDYSSLVHVVSMYRLNIGIGAVLQNKNMEIDFVTLHFPIRQSLSMKRNSLFQISKHNTRKKGKTGVPTWISKLKPKLNEILTLERKNKALERKNEYLELQVESLKREIRTLQTMTEQQAEKIARLEQLLNQ